MADLQQEFDDIVDHRRVRAVFQPIIELESGQTVGYKRWHAGLRVPTSSSRRRLFEYAYRTARSSELVSAIT